MSSIFGANYDSLTVGGRVFHNLTDLKTLYCHAVGGQFSTFREAEAKIMDNGYLTSGGGFRIMAIKTLADSAASVVSGAIGYGTTDVTYNSASPPTGAVYMCGYATGIVATLTESVTETALDFTVDPGFYIFALNQFGGNANFIIYGYEL